MVPAETVTGFEQAYPGWADRVGRARREVAEYLSGCPELPPVIDDVILVLSEFASNAVLHSRSRGGTFTVRVNVYSSYVWVEVEDMGGAWRPRGKADRPHGLDIVEALAGGENWGAEVTGAGRRIVWARLSW